MEAILTVIAKVAVMLILIALGCLLSRRKVITEKGAAEMTTLLLKVVTPCLIVSTFTGFTEELSVTDLLMASGMAALAMFIALGLSYILYRKEPEERQKVLRFAVIYGNTGFMGLPLVQAIVGGRAVIYGSFFIVVFNLICWTHGYRMMTKGKLNLKAALLNPGVLGLAVGLPIHFLHISLPTVIGDTMNFLAGLNTPLAMIVIGSHIARVSMKDFLTDLSVYRVSIVRLLIAPALYLAVLMLIRPEPELFVGSVIQAACPVAANAVLFAVEYHADSALASKTVALSTVLSIITIPLFTVLAQLACGLL